MMLPPVSRPKARLTVLDVTKWFGETSGGVKTYLTEKSAFVRSQPDLRHVVAIPGSEDSIEDDDGVRVYRLRGPSIPTQPQYRFLLATRSLRRIVEHERPDVIEVGSQFFVPWVARLATRRRPTPLVGFYHGNIERNVGPSMDLSEGVDRVARTVLRGYLRTVDRLFTARLAASDALAADLQAAGIRDITRVKLGVDTATFNPERRERRIDVRRSRGLPTQEPVAIYAGRVAAEKEIPWLVRAWPMVSMVSRAWLVIVGDGAMKQQLQAEAREQRSRIIWLPFESDRERLADLLACADVAIAPGPIETFGLAALEAMACGTPVVSVNRGAVPEMIRRARSGVTYQFRDPYDFATTVARFLRDDPARFGMSGRRHALADHRWPAAFADLFDFYERLRTADPSLRSG